MCRRDGLKMRRICVCTQSMDGHCGQIQFTRRYCAVHSGWYSNSLTVSECVVHLSTHCVLRCTTYIDWGDLVQVSHKSCLWYLHCFCCCKTNPNSQYSLVSSFNFTSCLSCPSTSLNLPLSHAPAAANDAPTWSAPCTPSLISGDMLSPRWNGWNAAICWAVHHYCSVRNMPGRGGGEG